MSVRDQLTNLPLPGVFLDERQVNRIDAFHSLLLEWNAKMNLVSRKSVDRAFALHFIDSIAISLFGARYGKAPYFDFGTGAGFPGVLFAILFPENDITLFERSIKKQTFLTEAIKVLELTYVTLKEEPSKKRLDGTFFARAVLPDEKFFEFFSQILKPGALVVLNSGLNRELRVKPTGFLKVEEECYELPSGEGGRRCQLFLFQGSKIPLERTKAVDNN